MARSEFSVIPAEKEHAYILAPILRDADRDEVRASHGVAPLLALLDAIRASTHCRSLVWGDRLAGIFGVVPMENATGSVWLLGSTLLQLQQRAFLRACRAEKPLLFTGSGMQKLVNYVDARNARSLRWAKWMGFELGEPITYGVAGLLFVPITLWRT